LLIAAGVAPQKIHSSYHAAGGFIADNRTEQGKARNRRIDIDLQGLDNALLASLASNAHRSTP
jgi:outer membrane protein OmpA-like peptidoglycan-associated protein